MKQSHKEYLNEGITKMTTHITTQRYLAAELDVEILVFWGSVYTEEEYPKWKSYKIAIECEVHRGRYSIEVKTEKEVYEILDYIDTLIPIYDNKGTFSNVYRYTMKGCPDTTHTHTPTHPKGE